MHICENEWYRRFWPLASYYFAVAVTRPPLLNTEIHGIQPGGLGVPSLCAAYRKTSTHGLASWHRVVSPGSTYVFLNVCLDFIWLIFAFWFCGFLNVFSWASWPFGRTFASNWRGYSSPGLTRWFGRFRSRAWKPYALCPLKTGHNVSPVWIVKKCGFPGFHLCQSFGPEWSTSRRIPHRCGCIYLWQESIYRTQVGMLGKLQLWTLSHFPYRLFCPEFCGFRL